MNRFTSQSFRLQHRFSSSVNAAEIERFSKMAKVWWDPNKEYALLHQMNPTRVQFIRSFYPRTLAPFQGMKILDIGCGGGFLSESLARLGGSVTGGIYSPI